MEYGSAIWGRELRIIGTEVSTSSGCIMYFTDTYFPEISGHPRYYRTQVRLVKE